jgi:hypothetical protein
MNRNGVPAFRGLPSLAKTLEREVFRGERTLSPSSIVSSAASGLSNRQQLPTGW